MAFLISLLAPPNASPIVFVPINTFSAVPAIHKMCKYDILVEQGETLAQVTTQPKYKMHLTMLGGDDELYAEVPAHHARGVRAYLADGSEDGDILVVLESINKNKMCKPYCLNAASVVQYIPERAYLFF